MHKGVQSMHKALCFLGIHHWRKVYPTYGVIDTYCPWCKKSSPWIWYDGRPDGKAISYRVSA
jgi:hypothetical protein